MKFSHKVFLSTLLLAALAFGACGYLLIDSAFQSTLDRERRLALEENQMLLYSLQTAAGGVPGALTDGTARQIARSLEGSGQEGKRLLRLCDETGAVLYASAGIELDEQLLLLASPGQRVSRLVRETRWYVHTACRTEAGRRSLSLESVRDVTPAFDQRTAHYGLYRVLMIALLTLFAAVMYLLARFLTAPVERLSAAARRFSEGDYSLRAPERGSDEVGLLARDFNAMADRLEQKIGELEETARRREDFMAAFAHEIKTPLTAVIGYADLLRSRSVGEETRFKAASYIFTEGKRLEALSLKLLDLIVLGRGSFPKKPVQAKGILESVYGVAAPSAQASGLTLTLDCQDALITAEPDLLATLLLNLCDNARKASVPGQEIVLAGAPEDGGYRLSVTDHGMGMSRDVLARATEPFYRADQSRSRAQNGTGLGLSLCTAVAALHNGRLDFHSAPGAGATVSCFLPGGEQT